MLGWRLARRRLLGRRLLRRLVAWVQRWFLPDLLQLSRLLQLPGLSLLLLPSFSGPKCAAGDHSEPCAAAGAHRILNAFATCGAALQTGLLECGARNCATDAHLAATGLCLHKARYSTGSAAVLRLGHDEIFRNCGENCEHDQRQHDWGCSDISWTGCWLRGRSLNTFRVFGESRSAAARGRKRAEVDRASRLSNYWSSLQ